MPIAKVTDRGSAQNNTAETSTAVTLTTGASISIGNYLVARVALDNAGASGAAPALTISDPDNTWTITTAANQDPGAANAGATCYIAYTRVIGAYNNNDNVTFQYDVSVTAKAIVVEEWSGFHKSVPLGVAATTAIGATGTPSIARTPTGPNQLVYTALAIEGLSADTYTQDSDTTNGSWVSLTSLQGGSGTAATSMTVRGAYKLVTAAGAQSWDPTITARDWAALALVFDLEPDLVSGPWGEPTPGWVSPTGMLTAIRGETTVSTISDINVQLTSIYSSGQIGFPSVSTTYTINPNEIESSEILGTVTTSLNVTPNGIPTQEVLGNSTITVVTSINPIGIPSFESVSNAALTTTYTVNPIGISSSENIGSVVTSLTVSPTGIKTNEVIGSTSVSVVTGINPIGIGTNENFGVALVTPGDVTINANGIASQETIGVTSVSTEVTLNPIGISSSESIGNISSSIVIVEQPFIGPWAQFAPGWVSPTGQLTAFRGDTQLPPPIPDTNIQAFAIGTNEQFGSISVTIIPNQNIQAFAIDTNEQFGSVSLTIIFVESNYAGPWTQITPGWMSPTGHFNQQPGSDLVGISDTNINAYGSVSNEQFGNISISTGSVTISPSSIQTLEAFGTPSVQVGASLVSPIGTGTSEAIGNVTVTPGTVTISPIGITTSEAFGTPSVQVGASLVSPIGILSSEQFGSPSASLIISPAGIPTNETLGVVTTSLTVSPYEISTSIIIGNPSITVVSGINSVGISSSETFGFATVTPGPVTVSMSGISSSQQIGYASVGLSISSTGIQTYEKLGQPSFNLILAPVGIGSAERVGHALISSSIQTVNSYGVTSATTLGNILVTKILSAQDADLIVFFITRGITVKLGQPNIVVRADGIL